MALLPLGETPSRHASAKPGEVAIVYPDGALTWAEFDRQVARRARWLRDAGVEPEQLVTIALPNTHRFYEHVFAVWRLGATPHIVSPRLPPAELEATLALA